MNKLCLFLLLVTQIVKSFKKMTCNSVFLSVPSYSRKKNIFSRDRLKLLLKQHCELMNGTVRLKVKSKCSNFFGLQLSSLPDLIIYIFNVFSFFPLSLWLLLFFPAIYSCKI